MRHSLRENVESRESGQALVLGALTMLLLALMLMLSFNVSQAVHEKIRLQQHADSMAYSMAVVEARTFNYLAYSNRAIAGAYVSMATLHAYMAAASVTSDMFNTAAFNFLMIFVQEIALCCSCSPPVVCCKFQHCIHAWKALRIRSKFKREARKYERKIKQLDQKFQNTIKALDFMVDFIHLSQLMMLNHARSVLQGGGGIEALGPDNAPQASGQSGAVGALNLVELTCAVEGIGIPCLKGWGEAGHDSRKKLMTDIADASRPEWTTSRPKNMLPLYLHPQFLYDLMRGIQGEGITLPMGHKGTAKITDGTSKSALHSTAQGTTGKTVGADEHGTLLSQWKHGIWLWRYGSEVYSNDNGGKHKPNKTHQGRHNQFEGVTKGSGLGSCMMRGNCFVKFRIQEDPDRDFGQPKVYAYLTQDLSVNERGQRGPWELNDTGAVTVGHGDQGEGTITLRPGQGAAVSKAMVYYHRLGNWREQPNLFNPYWRAKLHPFEMLEAAIVLGAAGNAEAAMLTALPDAPVN